MADSIPINIARALLPNRKDHIVLSHIYTPLRPDSQTGTQLKYTLPYVPNLSWTHLCPSWHDSISSTSEPYYEIIYEDHIDHKYITLPIIPSSIASGYYQPFVWPIPSMQFHNDAKLTLYVSFSSVHSQTAPPFSLKVLGFEDILPESATQYIMEDTLEEAWSFIKDDTAQTYSLLTPLSQRPRYPITNTVSIPKSTDLIISGIP